MVSYIRRFPTTNFRQASQLSVHHTTFDTDILPIFQKYCVMCHGTLGGWDGTSYQAAITSGDHAPVIIPGDVENSLLAQKLLGTSAFGEIMPPGGKLPDATIEVILDWIKAGAAEK
jgi:hypothetical protein